MITITRKYDILFNKISQMFEKITRGTFYTFSTAAIKKMSFYSNNEIITVRFAVEPEKYEEYILYAVLLQKEDKGELTFQFYYSNKDKAELSQLKQDVVLELCRMFTS